MVDIDTVNKREVQNETDHWDFEYDPSDGKFYDIGQWYPHNWGIDANGTNLSNFPTTDPNMQTHYWYGDTLYFQFDNPYYVAPSYRYLAFYGEVGSAAEFGPTFQELELTLGTPLNGSSEIKYGMNDTGLTFYESKAWVHRDDKPVHDYYLTVMNGDYTYSIPRIQYWNVENINAIFWYIDMGSSVAADVNGGAFWTYPGDAASFTLGKLYGTNTGPTTFVDASLIENYEFVCDLTKHTSY